MRNSDRGGQSPGVDHHLRVLIDGVQDYALLLLDPDGNVTSWSRGAQSLKGYTAQEIIGRNFACFFPPEEVVAGKPARDLAIAATTGRFAEEGWRVRKDGSRFWAAIVLSATRRDDGELDGFATLVRDISDHRRMEDLFRQVVEAAPNAMVMVNASGTIEMVNAQAEGVFGYPRGEMLGQPIEMLVPARFHGHHPGLRSAFFAEPKSRPMGAGRDLYAMRKDGSEFPVEIGLNPIETEQGTMVLSAIVDISARKRLEERFRQVVESAPNAMVMISRDGIIEMVNAQTERVFGYRRDEMLAQSVEMLVPERFRHAHPALRGAFFSSPLSRPMGAGRDLYALRKDGSEFPVEIGLNPIETEQGMMVLSAIVDISTRKRLEERFRQVVESAPNAMVMIDQDGAIEMVNAQTERVFGYARSEMLGRSVEILVPERFRRAHPGLRGAFFRNPLSRPMGAGRELFALRKDGSEFPVEIGLNPIETEEGTMVLSAIVDISDRKQRDEGIQAALREKDVLLGEIHHRVKNNLQIIHSLLDLQSARISDQHVLEMLRDSQNRIRSMALIHQTLYGSKDFAKVNFGLFLDSLVPILIGSYGVDAERIKLAIDVVQVELPIDAAVPCGLVVNELISNALKHAFEPGQCGEISVNLSRETGNGVTLSVADNGCGLPDNVDAATTSTLGLQLVTLLTDQLAGDLTIHRANPTRFVLRFPIER